MLDIVETQKILEDYFANITPEQLAVCVSNRRLIRGQCPPYGMK